MLELPKLVKLTSKSAEDFIIALIQFEVAILPCEDVPLNFYSYVYGYISFEIILVKIQG